MTEIVIASGKGGTGKTSLVGSLAHLARESVIVDCDVDAANLHLLIKHEVKENHEFSTSNCASIDMAVCSSCGLCHELCRFNAIDKLYDAGSIGEYRYRVEPLACEGCGLCVHACPSEAIAFKPVLSGHWYRSDSVYGPFFHGRLGIAQGNSGRLVSLLRGKARESSQNLGLDTILIDGPPGIGCPVIASITGANYLLIVTEPSKSAIHDMERLVKLAEHFRIPTAVCINKCDINEMLTAQVKRYAETLGIPVLGEIRFDQVFIDTQIMGQPYIASAVGPNADAIRKMWAKITESITETKRSHTGKFAV